MKPFLKWPGGKRRIVDRLKDRLPGDYVDRVYVEPFMGGGALYFEIEPQAAILSDANPCLIRTYAYARDRAPQLIQRLKRDYMDRNDSDSYYAIREQFNHRSVFGVDQAAQFVYLNKTCFNGLFRVNSDGGFNVPFGSYASPAICEAHLLLNAQRLLRNARLFAGDFAMVLHMCEGDEFVYLDPPYYTDAENFTGYVKGGFNDWQHKRLAWVMRQLDARGCKVMLSNSDTPFVRELYKDFNVETISAPRTIGASTESRKRVNEVVVRNY